MPLYQLYNDNGIHSEVVSITTGNSDTPNTVVLSTSDVEDLVDFLQLKGLLQGNNLTYYFTPDREQVVLT